MGSGVPYFMMAPPQTRLSRNIGIDVGKAWLDIDANGRVYRLQNNSKGFVELLRRARPPRSTCRFVCESGSYAPRVKTLG
jgi:transposase